MVDSNRPFLYVELTKAYKRKDGFIMKRIAMKTIKIIGITIGVIFALIFILLLGTYLYNSRCLRKEAQLIQHKGQYVEVDGHKMNLYIEGVGEHTLVFMAGSGVPSPVLEFKPLADRLSDKYRVVIIEKFGYGYSDEIEGERTVGIFTEQDREALVSAGIEGPYILCPHSASGFEAIWWANNYPEEVEAIVGLDMGVPEEYDYMGVDWENVDLVDPDKAAEDNEFYDFWVYKVGLMRYMNANEIFAAVGSDELSEEERNEYKALMYTKYSIGSEATINHEQWITERFIKEMKEICDGPIPDVPTLMFVSDGEMMTPMVKMADNWKLIHKNYMENVSNGKMVELDCGHYVHIEAVDRVYEETVAFVDAL
jgi:pimeloyl-ACP methyl ester carboxylesterase